MISIDPSQSIPAFYAGQSIFLTGATGFLGKMFIEKVLRSCPDVCEIFLLIRPKKGLDINQRLKKILNLPLFDKLREEQRSSFEKLVPISGEVSEKGLGLSVADRQMLIERVTITIHAAANVRFHNSLKYAILTNTRATRDVCILAQSMKNLIGLVYVSTAFTNVNEPLVAEKVYPSVVKWQKMIEVAETLDEHTLNIFTAKYLDSVPNTYSFSKNLAECVIQEYSSLFPCAIVRPSFVVPAIKEPSPGWIDNIYGPIGLYIGGGKGIVRVGLTNKYVQENIIPADIVINTIIVVSWKLGLTTFSPGSTPFVVNCVNQKRTSYEFHINTLFSIAKEIPFEETLWTPWTKLTDSFVVFYILTILFHMLPAMLIDIILKFSGRQPMLLPVIRKIYVVNRIIYYYGFHNWKYSITNISFLTNLIPSDNLDTFYLDYSYIDIREIMKNYMIGVKKFILCEDMNRLDALKAYMKRLYLFVAVVKTTFYIGMLWIIYKWIYS